ncbi:uncharacterized protein LOC136025765 [Artemia franciscana]|uniref:uncharacterized protein LOC136025765 n=1 Tax=Artemia franciscana TaxID=6661 RepID=UPI0032DB2E3E
MFNRYLSRDTDRSSSSRQSEFIGHDPFGHSYAIQIKPYRRRRRSRSRSPSASRQRAYSARAKRPQSLTLEDGDLDLFESRVGLDTEMRRSLRSISKSRQKTPQMTRKSGKIIPGFESISKLFNFLSIEEYWRKRKRSKADDINTIKNDAAGSRRNGSEEECKIRAVAARAVHEYVETSGRYVVIEQLEDLDISGLHNDTNHLLRAHVGDFVLATIGRNGRFGLCILGSPYSAGRLYFWYRNSAVKKFLLAVAMKNLSVAYNKLVPRKIPSRARDYLAIILLMTATSRGCDCDYLHLRL